MKEDVVYTGFSKASDNALPIECDLCSKLSKEQVKDTRNQTSHRNKVVFDPFESIDIAI